MHSNDRLPIFQRRKFDPKDRRRPLKKSDLTKLSENILELWERQVSSYLEISEQSGLFKLLGNKD